MLDDWEKKKLFIVDIACPGEENKIIKQNKKIQKYQQLFWATWMTSRLQSPICANSDWVLRSWNKRILE